MLENQELTMTSGEGRSLVSVSQLAFEVASILCWNFGHQMYRAGFSETWTRQVEIDQAVPDVWGCIHSWNAVQTRERS